MNMNIIYRIITFPRSCFTKTSNNTIAYLTNSPNAPKSTKIPLPPYHQPKKHKKQTLQKHLTSTSSTIQPFQVASVLHIFPCFQWLKVVLPVQHPEFCHLLLDPTVQPSQVVGFRSNHPKRQWSSNGPRMRPHDDVL